MACHRLRFTCLVTLLAALLSLGANAQDRAEIDASFGRWLAEDLWPEAAARGISRATFDAAFAGITPDLGLPELALPGSDGDPVTIDQAEFRSPALYFAESNLAALAGQGRMVLGAWRDTLGAIEARYGVPANIVVAIWGRESAYSTVAIPHNAVRALATEAFLGRRPATFRAELLAALEILERGEVSEERMRSSWAGGLGGPQFLPSTYLDYAVDWDRDGTADIWDSVPDILASIANYLAAHGWDRTRGWGLEVQLPTSVPCTLEGPEQPIPLADWLELGVTMADGSPFGRSGETIYHLLMPAGRLGPAFLVTPNFYVLKTYNESDLYALFIGHLADRMTLDDRPFRTAWQPVGGFAAAEVMAMQLALEAAGYDVGGADGLVGFRTRIAVGDWQIRAGLAATCFPDAALVRQLG